MCHPRMPWSLVLTCSLFIAVAARGQAQEKGAIKWRSSYNAARQEAEAKNLPMLIDFYMRPCFHCDRMDQSTFRDPRILATLNEKFIPLKINGTEDTDLAKRLQINLYPTIVLAGPDGRITQTLIGYQEAEVMNDHLNRLLATLTPNDTLQKDFQNAQKWEASGDYARAIGALRGILENDKGRPSQKSAQELLKKIEKRAEERLALARELQVKGQNAEALEALTETMRVFPGLQASKDASDLAGRLVQANSELKTAQRNKRVRELYVQAQDFYKSKDYIPCLDRCEIIIANFGDLPEGQQASLATEIKNNPEWLQGAADVMTDRLGGLYLALSDSYLKRGEMRLAQFYLQRVVQAFPGSRLAESAQIRLSQLRGSVPGPNANDAPAGKEIGSTRP